MPTAGWSGLWNHVEKTQHTLLSPRGFPTARRVSKIVRNGVGNTLAAERVFTALNEDQKQVVATNQPGNPIVNGGLIPIAVNNLTPVPSAQFIAMVEKSNIPVYVPDKSGNGGGGKLGLKL